MQLAGLNEPHGPSAAASVAGTMLQYHNPHMRSCDRLALDSYIRTLTTAVASIKELMQLPGLE